MTGSVSGGAIAVMILNVIICFGIPLGLMVWLVLKKKATMRPVLTGMLVFFVFQMLLRIPLMQNVLIGMEWFQEMTHNIWLYGIFLALTAGLFEEVGRFVGYKVLMKRQQAWWDGFAFGVGHGGLEAILITGTTYVNNLILAVFINTGGFEAYASALPPEAAQMIYQQMVGTPATVFLMAGVERIFAMAIQIALSILVLECVRRRNLLLLVLAIALHTLVDAPAVILINGYGVNIYLVEALLGLVAALACVYIWQSRRSFLGRDGSASSMGQNPPAGYMPPTPYVPSQGEGTDNPN